MRDKCWTTVTIILTNDGPIIRLRKAKTKIPTSPRYIMGRNKCFPGTNFNRRKTKTSRPTRRLKEQVDI